MLRFLITLFTPPTFAFGGGGGSPMPAAATAPLPPPPMLQSPQGAAAADTVRQRAAATRGYGGTIVTGPQGLVSPAQTSSPSLYATRLGGG